MAQWALLLSLLIGAAHLFSEIDPETASSPFFANENAARWAVLEQWHQYYLESRMTVRQALSQSGAREGNLKDRKVIALKTKPR